MEINSWIEIKTLIRDILLFKKKWYKQCALDLIEDILLSTFSKSLLLSTKIL